MTPEERFERIERILEFLAANQAQLSASAQAHDARIAENSRQIAENSRQIAENSLQISEDSRHVAENSLQIGQLTDLTLRIGRIVEELGRRMGEGFARLTESQRLTDERVNVLINVVERYFSGGRH